MDRKSDRESCRWEGPGKQRLPWKLGSNSPKVLVSLLEKGSGATAAWNFLFASTSKEDKCIPLCDANIIILSLASIPLWAPAELQALLPCLVSGRVVPLFFHLTNTYLIARNYSSCMQILIYICTIIYRLPGMFQYKYLNLGSKLCFHFTGRLEIGKLRRLNDFI